MCVIFCQLFFTLEISYYIVAANCKAAEFAGREIEQREDHGYAGLLYRSPPGIRAEAKKRMVEKITSAIEEAYHIGDTLIFLREHPAENVAQDGRLQSENPKVLEALKKIGA